MTRDPRVYLAHILECAGRIESYLVSRRCRSSSRFPKSTCARDTRAGLGTRTAVPMP